MSSFNNFSLDISPSSSYGNPPSPFIIRDIEEEFENEIARNDATQRETDEKIKACLQEAEISLKNANTERAQQIGLKLLNLCVLKDSKASLKIVTDILSLLEKQKKESVDAVLYIGAAIRLYNIGHIETAKTVYDTFIDKFRSATDGHLITENDKQTIYCNGWDPINACLLTDWCLRHNKKIKIFNIWTGNEKRLNPQTITDFLNLQKQGFEDYGSDFSISTNKANNGKNCSITIIRTRDEEKSGRGRAMSDPIPIPPKRTPTAAASSSVTFRSK